MGPSIHRGLDIFGESSCALQPLIKAFTCRSTASDECWVAQYSGSLYLHEKPDTQAYCCSGEML